MKYETISDATHAWVREFNAFPTDMISKLTDISPYEWNEVTLPAIGDRVILYDSPEECSSDEGEIVDCTGDLYVIRADDGTEFSAEASDFEIDKLDVLPMWGTMWGFGDWIDENWIEEGDGMRALSDCGFRVYEHSEWGYFFGIDGAGYDFFEAHWVPLYKKRGLKWHKEAGE